MDIWALVLKVLKLQGFLVPTLVGTPWAQWTLTVFQRTNLLTINFSGFCDTL